MNKRFNYLLTFLSLINVSGCGCKSAQKDSNISGKPTIQLILGTTRNGRSSDKIGKALKKFADKRKDVKVEIVDIKDFNLPFLYDQTPPSQQENITDPIIKKWSDKIKQANGYVIISSVYNSGYPGVLKNALDLIYKEWNNKPVAFVVYSGGPNGDTVAEQLHQVALGLQLKPISLGIKIPKVWQAFDENNNFKDKNIESQFNKILDELIKNING